MKTDSIILENCKLQLSFVRMLHIAVNMSVLVLCAFIGVFNRLDWEQPFSYIVSIFSIASMVLFSLSERLLVYTVSYFVYIIGIPLIHHIGFEISNDAFVLLLLVVSISISGSNYSSFAKNYINSRIINSKNLELDKLNRITDETLKKRTEELNKAVEYEKLRTNFFANISHELRTPLTLIFSAQQMLEIVLKKPSEFKEKENNLRRYREIIRQNCYRLTRLISNLIDLTKLNAGYIKPNMGNHNIVKVVTKLTLSIENFIESMGLKLVFDSELEESIISFDFEMLERIMLNLLSNAVKFTPRGGLIKVGITDDQNMIYISIKDTGIGIPEHMQTLVFERFVQADPTNTRNREGSGIGLSLVKSLVDLHNGTIALKSKEGLGTEFTIGLPKRVLPMNEIMEQIRISDPEHGIERINIEFSDIYPEVG